MTPPPEHETDLPSSAIRGLASAEPPPDAEQTISAALESWSSGLLVHEHPSEPLALLTAFTHLLTTPTPTAWRDIPHSLTDFLAASLLHHATETATRLTAPVLETCSKTITAATTLLSQTTHVVPPPALGDAVFLVLRLPSHATGTLSEALSRQPLPVTIAAAFPELLHRLSAALAHETDTPRPDAVLHPHSLPSATAALHRALAALPKHRLRRFERSVYPLVHALLEHVHQPTRSAGLACLRYLHDALGPRGESVAFLRGALLWADAETAVQAIPLLCLHAGGDDEAEKSLKRVLATLQALMTRRDGGGVCVKSATAAVTLLREPLRFRDGLLSHGVTWLRAEGAFLARVARLVGGGVLEERYILEVCEALSEGIRWCWPRADGFRGCVVDGCLTAVAEVPQERVFVAVRAVLLVLSCCNPTRMERLIRDLRASCVRFPSLAGVVGFLDTLELEVSCRKVAMGGLADRFFPELNQF